MTQWRNKMSGKKTKANSVDSRQSGSTSDKEQSKGDVRTRERISTKRSSRASADSSKTSSSNEHKAIPLSTATRAESQASLVSHTALNRSTRAASRSELFGSSPEFERKHHVLKAAALQEESRGVTSEVVFNGFDVDNPCKFLEDAITSMNPARVYVGLQHGMICEPDFKVNKVKLAKILKKPSKGPQTEDWKTIAHYLKAFTIMHSADDVSVFPVLADSINTEDLFKKYKINIHVSEDEKQAILDVIGEQFNSDMGNIFLLVHKVHKTSGDVTAKCYTVYDWYTEYKQGNNDVIYALENEAFLNTTYMHKDGSIISHRSILNDIQPPSSSISY